MAEISLMPLAGINTVAEDAALKRGGNTPCVYLRDAVNVDISTAGKATLRAGARKVSASAFTHLWQSPLHGDVFGVLAGEWGRVDPASWSFTSLMTVGEGDVAHTVLNTLVCAATPAGIVTYDGETAKRLTLDTPAAPFVLAGAGSLPAGTYGVAVAWLRGTMESALSDVATVEVPESGALDITLPFCLDGSATGARLYLTTPDGGELRREHDYATSATISISVLPELGAPATFRHLSPMPTGRYLAYWRGRLLTAKGGVLRFSEPLAYHLHDERHGFIQMPQRITFLLPVEGGIWVGQVDHVAFLAGTSPNELAVSRKAAGAPVPGSAIALPAEVAGTNASPDGSPVAVWLAENGYVMGAVNGQLSEPHAGILSGVCGEAGASVLLDRRLMTVVN